MASVTINGNVAQVVFSTSKKIGMTVTTNSGNQQQVVASDGGSVNLTFSGTGQHNVIGQSSFTTNSTLQVTFQYMDPASGAFSNSRVEAGGPYQMGNTNFLAVLAENGDDSDYNDAIVNFTWPA